MVTRQRLKELERDRPYLRHKRRQREAQSVREWNKLQALHHRRERREALDFKLKAIPAVVSAAVTSILLAQREERQRERQWAMFHTLWAMNRARGAK